jgi:adenylate cyclase
LTPADLIRSAEADAERFSATIRLIIFVNLTVAALAGNKVPEIVSPLGIALIIYGLGAIIGLILAWLRIFHPIIPFGFATFDATLISTLLVLVGHAMGPKSGTTFAMPLTGLVFVVLIHASMRFRPWLVIYTAGLFLTLIISKETWLTDPPTPVMSMPMMHSGEMVHFMHYGAVPAVLVALAALLLFMFGRRTRGLLLQAIEQTRRTDRLSRFFSPDIADRLAASLDEPNLTGHRQPVAVLFVDIRGFTALGEKMEPEALGAFLTEYRNRLTQPIFHHKGSVDKFIGDAIMAVFGLPEPKADDATRAVRSALDILEATRQWSKEREEAGLSSVAVGIGIHFGEVFAGALGNEQLLEYTVIGDTVNVAERLERLSREANSPLVISSALIAAGPEIEELATWRKLPPQQLKGHSQPVEVYCLSIDEG